MKFLSDIRIVRSGRLLGLKDRFHGYIFLYLWSVLPLLFYLVPLDGMFDPDNSICLFRRFVGVECWGCGMTRAFVCMMYGDIQSAILYNRLIVMVFPMTVSLWFYYLLRIRARILKPDF